MANASTLVRLATSLTLATLMVVLSARGTVTITHHAHGRQAQEGDVAARQAAVDRMRSGQPPFKGDEYLDRFKNAGTRSTSPDLGTPNPFAAPSRKPCSPLRSTKVVRTGQVNNPVGGCYRGDLITFEDPVQDFDPEFPIISITDRPNNLPLIWYNWAYVNQKFYRENIGSSGLDVGTTGRVAATQSILPDLGTGYDVAAIFPETFMKVISMYVTAQYHDDLIIGFYATDTTFYNFAPALVVEINAGEPTFVEFPAALFSHTDFFVVEVIGGGDVLHPGYDAPPDNDGGRYIIIDNVNLKLY